MGIRSLKGAMQSLGVAKKLVGTLSTAKPEDDVQERITQAMQSLGAAQEDMFQLREDLDQLQDERDDLKQRLQAAESWCKRSGGYTLVQTEGGAVVYMFTGDPLHYACPSCFNKQEIHPLQNNRTISGKYRCTGCSAEYPVELTKKLNIQMPQPHRY